MTRSASADAAVDAAASAQILFEPQRVRLVHAAAEGHDRVFHCRDSGLGLRTRIDWHRESDSRFGLEAGRSVY